MISRGCDTFEGSQGKGKYGFNIIFLIIGLVLILFNNFSRIMFELNAKMCLNIRIKL